MKTSKGRGRISSIITTALLIIIMYISFNIYRTNYFNGFEKAIATENTQIKFSRDGQVKYSASRSYKIENFEYNDAAFYKEIEVEPNTPYKISCMVKTENVQSKQSNEDVGATIGLLETTEYSKPIKDTTDWQKVEFMFNSKNREKVKISFRLGGNNGNCTGTAWFSDFKLEKGIKRADTKWNVACFILRELNVNIDGKHYEFKVNLEDIENVKLNMERYKQACYELSNKKMTINYDIIDINTPATTISYSDEHGYYISYNDVKDLIYNKTLEKEYDHVFVVARMEDENYEIPIIGNWIGLGGMDMYGIGYSLIRIDKNTNKNAYKYGITNQMPEEVFVHEFLHTLERNNLENGYETPALHDYNKYGYTEKTIEGLHEWYKDYMRATILDSNTGQYVGLSETTYLTQPPNNDNFKYSIDVEFNEEPENIFEEVLTIIQTLKKEGNKLL